MNTFLKYLGVLIVLLGVLCLVIYQAVPSNVLLVLSVLFEFAGMVTYVLINRRLD